MGISMFLPSSCSKGTWNSFMYLESKLIKRNLEMSMYLETKLFKRNKEISMYLETKLLIGTWGIHVPPVNVDKVVHGNVHIFAQWYSHKLNNTVRRSIVSLATKHRNKSAQLGNLSHSAKECCHKYIFNIEVISIKFFSTSGQIKFYLEFDTQETKYRFVIFSRQMFLLYTLRRIT